ncbi:activated Cdc42 kinase-like isoform X2 [Phlebotomus papatasi]|uniref:activated Cdc42 kinase-like isoform X2 n=1 Tax=Phlebotomus papatasi TaxID=29031 RepID=UPI002483493D|nr:activated Cdc42 kinase-like isoform X2 [Phlebotomus papatasi]
MMEPKAIDLCEFLAESELQQYYNSIKNELKITTVVHLKYASDEDLKQIGLSRPEIRRLRKFYDKYYPHGYLSKIKRLLQNPKAFDGNATTPGATSDVMKTTSSPSKVPSNKHIIPPDAICVNKQLGIGEFGIVQQGVWTNGTERIQVAIKCLCRERMQSNPMEFLKEAAIMHSIEHENIVRLYGVVLDTDSLMLVTELAHLRSLLECLKDSGLRVSFLTVPTLCEFAQQICNGMMYLENKRLIHRDLAARNILVFSKNKVKISDFGLSRALGVGKDYYQTNFNVNLKLPIAWCAPECINFLRFTNASDVWAYGVCLWEMFSYGFQPWAALTGHQILEAIDEPNYQRLEPPECCPREYYALMLKCWQHDPNKRPKFSEIYTTLPEMKPEQLKTVTNCGEAKKDHLMYRQGEIITVLDKGSNSPYWKGVLNSGKTGLFNPANTVTYLGSLPSSTNRDAFARGSDRSSKRKLRTEMISRPQNDLKHTGHVGLDGAYFGDVAFLATSQPYNHLPRQIVTPYKPSEDIEQTPLLHPTTPTSPDSIQTASGYFPENVTSSTNHLFSQSTTGTNGVSGNVNILATMEPSGNFGSYFDFSGQTNPVPTTTFSDSNPFANAAKEDFAQKSGRDGPFSSSDVLHDVFHSESKGSSKWPETTVDGPHEYHEISDDEMPAEKFDLGPSLLDEMDFMFRSMTATSGGNSQSMGPDFEHTNKKNEIAELTSKLARKNSSGAGSSVSSSGNSSNSKSKKKAGTVKPLSMKDDKILNQAIEFANEISARSMTDLVADGVSVTQSPKRKFSFRFPNLTAAGTHGVGGEKDATLNGSGNNSNSNTLTQKERKNFSEELKNVPDLQSSITDEHRQAYNSLVEKPTATLSKLDFMKASFEAGSDEDGAICGDGVKHSTTLPRNLIRTTLAGRRVGGGSLGRTKETDFAVPSHPAPRPEVTDSNPLRILRNKNFPIVRPRLKHLPSVQGDNNSVPIDGEDPGMCESPSYLVNTEYTYPERDTNDSNPIPLPPRDRNKIITTNAKRHVRKHALIIPASGLQRTLNKVSPGSELSTHGSEVKVNNVTDNNYNTNSLIKRCMQVSKLPDIDQTDAGGILKRLPRASNGHDLADTPGIHESINMFACDSPNADTASLHFESILESEINKVGEMSSPDVVDGFSCFEIQKDTYDKYSSTFEGGIGSDSELRNLDMERKKSDFSGRFVQKNELADNALFNRVRESVNSATSAPRLAPKAMPESSESYTTSDEEQMMMGESQLLQEASNSVSCEDLLEFSERKPKGRERGAESDEVRIMIKVLGKKIPPEMCLETLELVDWDVHKAIKIMKLSNMCNVTALGMCMELLQENEWDLPRAALKLSTRK